MASGRSAPPLIRDPEGPLGDAEAGRRNVAGAGSGSSSSCGRAVARAGTRAGSEGVVARFDARRARRRRARSTAVSRRSPFHRKGRTSGGEGRRETHREVRRRGRAAAAACDGGGHVRRTRAGTGRVRLDVWAARHFRWRFFFSNGLLLDATFFFPVDRDPPLRTFAHGSSEEKTELTAAGARVTLGGDARAGTMSNQTSWRRRYATYLLCAGAGYYGTTRPTSRNGSPIQARNFACHTRSTECSSTASTRAPHRPPSPTCRFVTDPPLAFDSSSAQRSSACRSPSARASSRRRRWDTRAPRWLRRSSSRD